MLSTNHFFRLNEPEIAAVFLTAMHSDSFDLTLVSIAPRLRAYFVSRLPDAAATDDLIQETLLKAIRARSSLRNPAVVEAWIFRIAHRTLADYYRQRIIVGEIPGDVRAEQTSSVKDDITETLACSARCYLGTLSPTYRVPVHLAEYEGLSHSEIAQQLGLSLATTKSRVRRGKLMVRSLMETHCQFEYDIFGNVIGYQVRPLPRRVPAIK